MLVISRFKLAKFFIGLIFLSLIVILIIIVANHSISCIDKNGCLRSHCVYSWLKQPYRDLIDANQINCPYQDNYSR
jgi:hypothetical protein